MTGVEGRAGSNRIAAWGIATLMVLALAGCEREMFLPGETLRHAHPRSRPTLPGEDGRAAALRCHGHRRRPSDQPAGAHRASATGQAAVTTPSTALPHATLSSAPTEVWVARHRRGQHAPQPHCDRPGRRGRPRLQPSTRARSSRRPRSAAARRHGVPASCRISTAAEMPRAAGWPCRATVFTPPRPMASLWRSTPRTGAVIWRHASGHHAGRADRLGRDRLRRRSQLRCLGDPTSDDGRQRLAHPQQRHALRPRGRRGPRGRRWARDLSLPPRRDRGRHAQHGVTLWNSFVAGGRLGTAYASINDITSDPVVVGGTIYAGNQSGRVVAMNARTGTRQWTATGGGLFPPFWSRATACSFVSDRQTS